MSVGAITTLVVVLALSVALQMLAAVLAIRLIPLSRGWAAWLLIAASMVIRIFRTLVTMLSLLRGEQTTVLNATEHWLTLLVSALLVAGIWAITPLFQAFRRALVQEEQANRALRQRTVELEHANREMETFSYSVAHDLRSPLRSLDGFSKYLLEHAADRMNAREQDYLHRMRAAAQRMGRLIDDLLTLARIGRLEMRIERVDLSALVTEILEGLQQRDPQRQVTVEVTPGIVVHGDGGLLQIALENLLGNAWKFTARREEALIAFGVAGQGHEAIYFVRDNGAGFDMAYVDKLFQPFQRLHTEEEFAGTGIGLALVRRIIERHGGRIWAEGVPDHGATFYFTLGGHA